jgi:hypothetical protein
LRSFSLSICAFWTGTGITSSAAAAANAIDREVQSVGYGENATLPLGAHATFRGQPVASDIVEASTPNGGRWHSGRKTATAEEVWVQALWR